MGILKKIIIVALILNTNFGFAQTESKVTAFENSYTQEIAGEYGKAIQELKQVYDETSYPINLRLGWLSHSSGLFTESIAYYTKAIQLMPYSVEARLGLVYPAGAVGNWSLVMKTYKDILDIDSKNYTANYKLASIYYGRKEYSSATKYLETIVNLYPFDYNSTILYAWNNYQLGKIREAKLLFNKALMLSPKDASATEGLNLIE